jgi:hypothetical protein
VRRIRARIAVENPSGLSKPLGKALDFSIDVAGGKIGGYNVLQNEDCDVGVRMEDGHPGIIRAELSRHGMFNRTPCEAKELIAGFALVSIVDRAVGMDCTAHGKTVYDEIMVA